MVPRPLIVHVPAPVGVHVTAPKPFDPMVVCRVCAAAPSWRPMVTTWPTALGALMVMVSGTPTMPLGAAMKPFDAAEAAAPWRASPVPGGEGE